MFDYKSYIKSLANFMVDNGYTVRPLPKIRLSNVKQHGLFIMTGYYDNEEGVITVFINGRHPKDVLRTVAHELIHHKQSEEGLLTSDISYDERLSKNKDILPLEEEAYLKGNIAFRLWSDTFKE